MTTRPAVEFTVWGEPGVAGNKSPGIWRSKDGRQGITMREGRSKGAQAAAKLWRERVVQVVEQLARDGAPLLEGPLALSFVVYRSKPASAPKRRRILPTVRPDLSKMLRAIEDPMIGVLIRDDSQFVEFVPPFGKRYADDTDDPRPRAEVRIWRVEPLPAIPAGGLAPDLSIGGPDGVLWL